MPNKKYSNLLNELELQFNNISNTNESLFFTGLSHYAKFVFEDWELLHVLSDSVIKNNSNVLLSEKIIQARIKLSFFYDVVHKSDEVLSDFEKEKDFIERWKFAGVVYQYEKAVENNFQYLANSYFTIKYFKPFLDVVHDYLKRSLSIKLHESPELWFISENWDIQFDEHILLRPKFWFLLNRQNNWRYEHCIKLSALKAWLAEYLHRMSNKSDRSLWIRELAAKCPHSKTNNKVTISNSIKDIQDICDEYWVKQVFHSTPDNKWELSPMLDCCKNM